MPAADQPVAGSAPPRSRVWIWVVIAFLVQMAVWTAWLVIAGKNRVQEVPLVRQSG